MPEDDLFPLPLKRRWCGYFLIGFSILALIAMFLYLLLAPRGTSERNLVSRLPQSAASDHGL